MTHLNPTVDPPKRSSLSLSARKYWAIFKTQILDQLAYPVDLLSRSIMIILFMWIFAQLWRTTYSVQGTQTINNISLPETLWYLLLAETIVLSRPNVALKVAEQVKDGSIAYVLSKPYNFLLYQFSIGLANSLPQMITNFIAGGAIVWMLVGPPPHLDHWPLVLISVFLAWIIYFAMNAFIGLLAFITEDVNAFLWIYSKFVLILGGTLIPLDFFPKWLQDIALSLPFAYSVYGPARLFISPNAQDFFQLASFQLLWIAICCAVVIIFYKRAAIHLSINGG